MTDLDPLEKQAQIDVLSQFEHALHVVDFGKNEYDGVDDCQPATLADANAFSSKLVGDLTGMHTLALDIDMPVRVIPSSTPGHGHLFIDHPMSWTDYLRVIRVLADVGIVQEGYWAASERRGHTTLRLPWVKKDDLDESLMCVNCRLHPSALDEYTPYAAEQKQTNAEYVYGNEGTLNRLNGHFRCTDCFIKAGQPLGVTP